MTVAVGSCLPEPENLLKAGSEDVFELSFRDETDQHFHEIAVEEFEGGDELDGILNNLKGVIDAHGFLIALVVETEAEIFKDCSHATVHPLSEDFKHFLEILFMLKAHPFFQQHLQDGEIVDDALWRGVEADLIQIVDKLPQKRLSFEPQNTHQRVVIRLQ